MPEASSDGTKSPTWDRKTNDLTDVNRPARAETVEQFHSILGYLVKTDNEHQSSANEGMPDLIGDS